MATQSYSTPGSYTFTLPISTGITIRIAGAAGGTGGTDGGPPGITGGAGGKGRYGVFTLPDYSYGEFTFVVGGAGGDGGNSGTTEFNGGSGGSSAISAGGGGQEDSPSGSSGGGAGGGGASSVTFANTLIAIAGGGGGGGGGTRGAYSNLGSTRTDGENGDTFSASTSSPDSSNVTDAIDTIASKAGTGGDGGGAGGGGGGYPAGARGEFPGNDNVHPSEGGYAGGSFYRSDRLTLSSQTTYTSSTNGYIEIEYTEATFDTSAATVSKAGPYYTTAGTEMKFSALRRDFRAQQPKTTSGGSEETSPTLNVGSISASELLRNANLSNTNPIVPQCQENLQISTSNDWKISQFRNSIKYYYLTQESSKTSLNYILHGQPWNNNLGLNINKIFFLDGTCGSVSTSDPAVKFDANVYNLNVIISGDVYGAGGAGGTAGANGGDGGDAVYIDTNSTGTVTIKTTASAKVYGGGGGGGGGGKGGKGGNGQKTTSTTSYTSTGSVTGNYGGSYDQQCRSACESIGGQWANNCYKTPGQGGCGGNSGDYWSAVCYTNDASGYTNVTSCKKTVTSTSTSPTTGGDGGAAVDGGNGRGYLQSKSNGATFNGGKGGGDNAGTGGNSGSGGNGGDWAQDGKGGADYNGIRGSNGTAGSDRTAPDFNEDDGPELGGSGGTGGAAVSGTGYSIDNNSDENAFIGSK